jgi:drug/metabolite transporter (DMT)-like permease
LKRERALKKLPLGILISYLAIYVVWGSTYFFIKMAVATMPPFYLVGLRFILGGLAFLIISMASGKLKVFPRPNEILSALFLGSFLLLLGNGLVSVGEQSVDSYLAALVIASTPLVVAFFNGVFFREKIPFTRLIGMLCGIAGVALILYNGKNILNSITPGAGLVLGGLCCWSFATSIGHKMKVHPNNLVNSGLQMFMAGVIGLIISWVAYEPPQKVLPAISAASWIGLAYLTVFGAIAFYAFSYLIHKEPSIRIATYAIVNPLIAVVLGIVVGGEKPAPFLIMGFPLVLAGLALTLFVRKRAPEAAPEPGIEPLEGDGRWK